MIAYDARPARVLLVEDDWVAARVVEYTLRKVGYQVKVTGRGALVEAETAEFDPDAIILDLNLPDASGPGILQRIRAREGRRRRAVMVLSAHIHEHRPGELDEADAIANKPIAPSKLLALLARLKVPPSFVEPAHPEGAPA